MVRGGSRCRQLGPALTASPLPLVNQNVRLPELAFRSTACLRPPDATVWPQAFQVAGLRQPLVRETYRLPGSRFVLPAHPPAQWRIPWPDILIGLDWLGPTKSSSSCSAAFSSCVSLRPLWAAARSASPSAHHLVAAVAEAHPADRHCGGTRLRVRLVVAPDAI